MMDEQIGAVGGKDPASDEVRRLRAACEDPAGTLKRIAEVQTRHLLLLKRIEQDLALLPEIYAFIRQVASDHEHRIRALEQRPH